MGGQRAAEGGGKEFERVLDALLLRMSDGTYALGSLLPPQRELAQDLGVSRDTVQRVLRELSERGLVESRQGSGSRVIGSPPPQAQQPQPAGRSAHPGRTTLRPHMARAFERPEVALDVFTFTSESLAAHFWIQAERIRSGEITPQRIALRMLLPSEDLPLPYPRATGDPDDPRPQERLRGIARRHLQSLRLVLEELRAEQLVADVDVDIRWVPLTPTFKLYLFNRTEALHGMYKVVERPIVLDEETIPALDVVGLGAVLERHVKDDDPNSPGSVFVTERQEWFDSVWRHLTE
ncbi:winged helix-turn-helix transcriptional regulator [Streptomyces ferrugineus]|uniref:Winged helix-turn-helix transcriptional regulator n=1 Tax=Streptomyces ferrugineus TaxID=1413221 RepID=A0A7M2SM45_9ACTN|nr:winged helix-turn-helix domain-containing protein [Streptomyces ferrugineus]QOV37430.1 winged helix-turn-helix transcriptional regulator [Streptomyces ferrugineus]